MDFWKILETVKQKSESVINVYKEDLAEFSRTIVQDTSNVLQDKITALKTTPPNKRASKMAASRLARLQQDQNTYCNSLLGDPEYQTWLATFDLSTHTEDITALLSTTESVRQLHTQLVPTIVAYRDFWSRYFFRYSKFLLEEERRAALLKSTINADEEELTWEVDDDKAMAESSGPYVESPPGSAENPKVDEIPLETREDNVPKEIVEESRDKAIAVEEQKQEKQPEIKLEHDKEQEQNQPIQQQQTPLQPQPPPTIIPIQEVVAPKATVPVEPNVISHDDLLDAEIEQKFKEQSQQPESAPLPLTKPLDENLGDEEWVSWE